MRIIPFKKADLAKTRLVDGGRWLLASAFGTVMVYDLDDLRDEGKILIPRYADAHENLRTTALNVDILTSASTLTFNLAITQDLPGMVDRLQLLSHDRVLIFEGNEILLCNIPALETCIPSSLHPGSIIIPCSSISLPGTKFTRGGPSQLRSSSSMCYEFVSATDAGIFAVKLSGTASSAHMLHAIGDEERVIDVLVGARRVYVRSRQFAEAFSYRTEQIGEFGIEYRTTPIRERSVTKESIPYFEPQMDEVSGRIAMAASSYALGVFYYSQFDQYKLFIS
ncbi:hypothetical protein HWV62_12885 [Athelia sp. TMB]|nr:hypothetical protein HWV62_12885 [Athelia sp. TMB]